MIQPCFAQVSLIKTFYQLFEQLKAALTLGCHSFETCPHTMQGASWIGVKGTAYDTAPLSEPT